jgi:hypothetical protein
MKLITKEILGRLEKAGAEPLPVTETGNDIKPWLKLFNPVGAGTWLIAAISEDGDTMYGLCDLGMGHPELGYVSLNELESLTLPFGLTIERDMYFEPTKTLAEYAVDARTAGHIDTNGG